VIHNGIIENFQSLRARLEKDGHVLSSETDTECVAHLIEEHVRDGAGLTDAVRATVRELQGAYALVVVSSDEPGLIVGVRVSSPLIVGLGDGETLLASDIPAVLDRTTTVIPVEEGQVVEARREGRGLHRLRGERASPRADRRRARRGARPEGRVRGLHAEGDPRAAGRHPASTSAVRGPLSPGTTYVWQVVAKTLALSRQVPPSFHSPPRPLHAIHL